MVKKLFKHEFLAYFRLMIPLYAGLLGIALMARLLFVFENDTTVYNIISGSSIVVYVIAILAALLLTTIFVVVRFYKNLFTGEGYLSFTLPVSSQAHITVKIVTAVAFEFISLITVIASLCIISSGELLTEIYKAVDYIIKQLYSLMEYNIVLYALEILLLFTSALFTQYLLFYTCIAIGQLFRKNRVIAAIGVYFGFYIISQIIGTVITVLTVALQDVLPFDKIGSFIESHPYEFFHIIFCSLIVLYLVMAAVYYIVTNLIIRKKLNLE